MSVLSCCRDFRHLPKQEAPAKAVGVVFYLAHSSLNYSESSPGLDEETSTQGPGLKPAFSSHNPPSLTGYAFQCQA